MTIINHISVRGLRNVLDHDIALPELVERFLNIQILASTDSPFIILNMERTAVYNMDTRKIHIGPDTMTYDEIGRIAFGV